MNKDIFANLLKNKLIRKEIFYNLRLIHTRLYLQNKQCEILSYTSLLNRPDILAAHNYIDLLKDYYKRSKYVKDSEMLLSAIKKTIQNDNMQLLIYLIDISKKWKIPLSNTIMNCAAEKGSDEIIQYLHSLNDTTWNYNESFSVTPLSGNLNVVKWFYQESKQLGIDITTEDITKTFSNTARSGNIEIMRWVVEKYQELSYIWISGVWTSAVYSRNIDLLIYLYNIVPIANIFPLWNLLNIAISLRDIPLLDWLHSKQASFDRKIMYDVSISKSNESNFDLFKWVFKNIGVSDSNDSTYPMDFAIHNNNFTIIKWIHENSSLSGSKHSLNPIVKRGDIKLLSWFTTNNRTESFSLFIFDHLFKFGQREVLEWIQKNRTETFCFSANAIDHAINRNDLDFVKWIHKNTKSTCTFDSFKQAILLGNLDMVDWILKNISQDFIYKIDIEFLSFRKDITDYLLTNYSRFQILIDKYLKNSFKDISQKDNCENVIKYILNDHPSIIIDEHLQYTSRVGNLDLVKRIHRSILNNRSVTDGYIYKSAIVEACVIENMEIIDYLCDNMHKLSLSATKDIDVVESVIKLGCSPKIIKYLHRNTCFRLLKHHIHIAASVGNSNIIKLMLDLGFICTEKTMEEAAIGQHMSTVCLLLRQRCRTPSDLLDTLIKSVHFYPIYYFESLMDEGIEPSSNIIDTAIEKKDLSLCNFLYKRKCGCSHRAINRAIQDGNAEVVEWLFNRFKFQPDKITEVSTNKDIKRIVENYKLKKRSTENETIESKKKIKR